jgi:hypothetical protein
MRDHCFAGAQIITLVTTPTHQRRRAWSSSETTDVDIATQADRWRSLSLMVSNARRASQTRLAAILFPPAAPGCGMAQIGMRIRSSQADALPPIPFPACRIILLRPTWTHEDVDEAIRMAGAD